MRLRAPGSPSTRPTYCRSTISTSCSRSRPRSPPSPFHNEALIYDLLFKAASEPMLMIAADPKHFGARIGITAGDDVGGRHLDFLPVTQHRRRRWCQVHQRLNRVGRSGAGAHLKPMAQQDEVEQDDRRLEEVLPPQTNVAPTLNR